MKFHCFSCFWVIDRTNSVRTVTSDWFVTWFGNDGRFWTRSDRKCSSGQRTDFSMGKSLQKVFPTVVINGVLKYLYFWHFWHFWLAGVLIINSFDSLSVCPNICCTSEIRYDSFVQENGKSWFLVFFHDFSKTRVCPKKAVLLRDLNTVLSEIRVLNTVLSEIRVLSENTAILRCLDTVLSIKHGIYR